MAATIILILAVCALAIVCAYLGYVEGFDKGFETAIEMYERELKDVQSDIDIQ